MHTSAPTAEREWAVMTIAKLPKYFHFRVLYGKAEIGIQDVSDHDFVEVVRCKDCKFFEPDTYSDDWCSAKISGVSKGMISPNFDSYCSDAVKRGKEDV